MQVAGERKRGCEQGASGEWPEARAASRDAGRTWENREIPKIGKRERRTRLAREEGEAGEVGEAGVVEIAAVEGQVAVIDFEREGGEGGAIDAAAVAAPEIVGVPAAGGGAVPALAGEQLGLQGRVPARPVVALPLKHGQRAVVPVVEVRRAGAGPLLQ